MLSWLGEGRWWEEGSSNNPATAMDRGREGVRQQCVCWWGPYLLVQRQKRGQCCPWRELDHLRMQGTCCRGRGG